MLKKIFCYLLLVFAFGFVISININTYANSDIELLDSASENSASAAKKIVKIQEVKVISSRETNERDKVPSSVTSINMQDIEALQINSIKNSSVTIANLFIPDYGSKMSSSIYIRGVGSRSTGQTVGFYVDNVPYLNKSNFDFAFFDIQQIEVLRGSQSTLYGRNSMGGIINISTLSPFYFQGSKVELTYGNYGIFNTKVAHYNTFNDNLGLSVGAYIDHGNGFFINSYNNSRADDFLTGGTRVKLFWNITNNLFVQYALSFEKNSQSAFPYGYYNDSTGIVSSININDESSYKQNTLTLSQHLEYKFSKINITSTTSYQYLDDKMNLDQDFTSEPVFTLQQRQKRNAITEEIILRPRYDTLSSSSSTYQWNLGCFIFYDGLSTSAPVLFKSAGVDNLIEKKVTSNLPSYVSYNILEDEMPIVDELKTPTLGAAVFHQSTFTNVLFRGLDITAGIRLDYEKAKINYNNSTGLTQAYSVTFGNMTIEDEMKAVIDLQGVETQDYFQVIPKFAVNYVFDSTSSNRIFASVSRGHKAGGFNLQMFSDITQNNLRSEMMQEIRNSIYNKLTGMGMPADAVENNITSKIPLVNKITNIGSSVSYKPEYSWDYELGGNFKLFDNKLFLDISVFLMYIKNMQITQFSPNGFGRMLSNAGAVTTKGLEASLMFNIISNSSNKLISGINYGYASAIFSNYKDSVKTNNNYLEVDYSGNFVPYAPQHTISVFTSYAHNFNSSNNNIINSISVNLQLAGAGKIYWEETNNLYQEFYQILNGKISISVFKKIVLEFWMKNISNSYYRTFYFETLGNKFFQSGKPRQLGATVRVDF